MPEPKTTEAQKAKRDSFVTLCGRVFHADSDYFPQADYHGRTMYFCTEICLGAYLADPERFVAAHKKSYKKHDEQPSVCTDDKSESTKE